MILTYAGYSFQFWIVTTRNRYEPEDFTFQTNAGETIAVSNNFSFGEKSGLTPGKFVVRFAAIQGGFAWTASAEHSETIRGIKVRLDSFPAGLILAPFEEIDLLEGQPGRCLIYPGGYYPIRHRSSTGTRPESGPVHTWSAPFVIFSPDTQPLALSTREVPPRVKKIWLHRGPAGIIVQIYNEADACRWGTSFQSSEWQVQSPADWRSFVSEYSDWFGEAFRVKPFAERENTQPWLRDISLIAILHGMTHDGKVCHTYDDMAARLEQLSALFSPQKTLVKLAGFEGPIDRRWPDALPAPEMGGEAGFARLAQTARRVGYRLMPHLNVWGASFGNPRTDSLLAHQIYDQDGHPSTWSYDYDQDEIAEEIFAYISPDAAEWRQVMVDNIQGLVERGVSAIYLDQTGTFINDLRHDHFRGLNSLYRELAGRFPTIQLAGEAPTQEVTAALCALVCGISILPTLQLAEMYRLLFGRYIRQYGYNLPPQPYRGVWGAPDITDSWNRERFLQYEERSGWVNGIPSLNITDRRVDLTSDLVQVVLHRAKRYTMVA